MDTSEELLVILLKKARSLKPHHPYDSVSTDNRAAIEAALNYIALDTMVSALTGVLLFDGSLF